MLTATTTPTARRHMHEAASIEAGAPLARAILALGSHVRYVAVAIGSDISMQERPGLAASSSSSSDFYEELLVNPALLLLATRRGELDCGGLRHLIVGYGNFNQVVLPTSSGHVSVAVERGADADDVAQKIAELLPHASA
jgi:hypothetical protein